MSYVDCLIYILLLNNLCIAKFVKALYYVDGLLKEILQMHTSKIHLGGNITKFILYLALQVWLV